MEIYNTIKDRDDFEDFLINDITEYGRMVHSEMNALMDAARLGRSTKGSILYVTTFPCHNCAKHIISSGISEVFYIEPYPKSRAKSLYIDSISHDKKEGQKVQFNHYSGISPTRFRDIFEKNKRQTKDGQIQEWYQEKCSPRLGITGPPNFYPNEAQVIKKYFDN